MNDRQLDTWVIYKDPQEVLSPLKIIWEHKDEILANGPLDLFVNCVSFFEVNGEKVGRYFDTFICSREADLALCLSSARYYDEDLGLISATPEDIAKFLDKHGIPYRIIVGGPQKEEIDNPNLPETWMARERYVLEDSLEQSKENGCTECVLYPSTKAKLSIGYYLNGEYHEIWGLNFNGLIETSNPDGKDRTWTLLINEGDKRNISIEEARDVIREKGLIIKEGDNPLQDLSKSSKLL